MIPTYNQSGFIIRAIQSSLEQDYPNLEIVISDDCSTDDTQQVVEGFISRSGDARVRYFRNASNLGILRNYHHTLFENVTGDWVVNLDADDFFVDRTFLSQAMAMAGTDPAITLVFGNYCEYDERTGQRADIRNHGLPALMDDRTFLDRYADDKIVWNHNSIVYNRRVALQIGCYWDAHAPRSDWESFLRFSIGRKVATIDCMAAAWVQHGGNETKRLDADKYLNNFTLIDGVVDFALAHGLDRDFVQRWRRRLVTMWARSSAIAYLRARDYRGLARFLRSAEQKAPGLKRRLLTDPQVIARGALAINPRLYQSVKQLIRR